MKLLFVSPFLPYPPVAGGHRQVWSWLTRLASRHEIAFVGYYEREAEAENVAEIARHCAITRARLRQPTPHHYPSFAQVPRFVSEWYSGQLAQELREVAGAFQPDVVQFLHTNMGQYHGCVGAAAKVITALDIAWIAHRRRVPGLHGVAKVSAQLEWLRMLRHEAALFARADHVIAMSERDAGIIRAVARHERVTAVPPGVDTDLLQPRARRAVPGRVLYLGHMEHSPNLDGLLWLYREMWPPIVAGFPAARLIVAGSGTREQLSRVAPEALAKMEADPTIELTGFVDDLGGEMDHCAAMAAPLRMGAGVRNKVIEAMAAGLPVVTTTLGTEGLAVRSGRELLVADTPEAFSRELVHLLESPSLQQTLGQAGRELVAREHNNDQLASHLEHALIRTIGARG